MSAKWTLGEWRDHVFGLSGDALWTEASAANGTEFYRVLRAEGFTGAEIETVLSYFAERFRALGEDPPPGGLFDLSKLELQDA